MLRRRAISPSLQMTRKEEVSRNRIDGFMSTISDKTSIARLNDSYKISWYVTGIPHTLKFDELTINHNRDSNPPKSTIYLPSQRRTNSEHRWRFSADWEWQQRKPESSWFWGIPVISCKACIPFNPYKRQSDTDEFSSSVKRRHTGGRHRRTGTNEQPTASLLWKCLGGYAMTKCQQTMVTGWKIRRCGLLSTTIHGTELKIISAFFTKRYLQYVNGTFMYPSEKLAVDKAWFGRNQGINQCHCYMSKFIWHVILSP